MTTLRRIDPLSVAKVFGVIYAALGLLAGLFLACTSIVGGVAASGSESGGTSIFLGGGLFAVVILPLLYGAMGAFGGLVSATLYNIAVRWTGGIEVEFS